MAFFSKLMDPEQLKDTHKQIPLPSPMSGSLVSLDTFPCESHKQRMFGEGVAIQPSGYQIKSPFNALVEYFPATCECVRLKAKNGVRLQIQFGQSAETLMGEGFKAAIKARQIIKKGDVIMEFDLARLKQRLPTTLCPITVLNSEKVTGIMANYHQVIAMEDTMMTLVL